MLVAHMGRECDYFTCLPQEDEALLLCKLLLDRGKNIEEPEDE